MKRVIIAVIMLMGLVFAKPWWVRDLPWTAGPNTLRAVFVVDDVTVWAVGENGKVYCRSGDLHSHSWELKLNLSGYDFNDVYVIGSNVWVVGENQDDYHGVIYKSTNNGDIWVDITPPLSVTGLLATPFVKVKMANVNYGYISCGTGTVLATTNGGASWRRCNTPWNNSHNDSLSVQYNGLWVDPDPQHPDHLRVSGDAFGIIAESQNAGEDWTVGETSAFEWDLYDFPDGTNQPYDPKLANFDLCFPNQNTGYLGLSNGRVGYTTNGGSTWTTQTWDALPVWFHDVADSQGNAIFGAGSYHVLNRLGSHEQNYHSESYTWANVSEPFNGIGFSDGSIGYAVGDNTFYNGSFAAIMQRYNPAGFVFDNVTLNELQRTITVNWHTTFEDNTSTWGISFQPMQPIQNGNFEVSEPAAQTAHNYSVSYSVANADCRWWYVTINLMTQDFSGSWWPNQYCWGPVEILLPWVPDTAQRFSPPTNVVAEDTPNDNGGSMTVSWNSVPNATGYYIGRAENPEGPFCFYYGYNGTDTYWIDNHALVNGKSYYYIVLAHDGWERHTSVPSSTVSAVPLDNEAPVLTASNCQLVGSYDDETQTIKITWQRPNDIKDIAAYWVCPETEQRYCLAHSSPINRTIYYWPLLPPTPPNAWIAVAAMDYSNNISEWLLYEVFTAPTLVVGNEPCASGLNNSRKLLYSLSDQLLKAVFTDNDTVFYRTSSDEGSTWSTPQALCPGIYPGLVNDASNEQYLVCVQRTPNPDSYDPTQEQEYYQPGSYTWKLLYKKTSSGVWDTQTTILNSIVQIDNGGSIVFSAPTVAITSDDTVHVTVAHTIYEQYMGAWRWKWQLLYTNFHKNKPQVQQWFTIYEITQSASAPPPGACPLHPSDPTIVSDAYNNINVGFGISSQIKYCYRKDRVWQTVQSLTGTGMHGQPCLGINGDEITLVWAGNLIPGQGSLILCRRRFVPNGRWGNTECIDQGENLSVFPVALNNKVLWCEQIDGDNWDIYYSYLEGSAWSTPENLTNDSPRSLLPQIAYNDRYDRVYYIFTARDTIPYWVLFKKKDTVRGAFYGYSLGAEEVSASTVERDTFIDYGGAAYKHMDRAAGQLSYGVTGLNPNHDYEFAWDWYHELNNPIHLKLKINNELEHTLNIPPRHHISPRIPIPANLYANGTLSISINPQGNTSALLSGFAIFDVTDPESGPQAGHEYEANAKPSLKLAPNPFSGQLQITYDLGPKTENGTLFIYDACGRRVKSFTLCNSSITPHNSIIWNRTDDSGRSVSSGVYFIRLQTDDYAKVEKAILLK